MKGYMGKILRVNLTDGKISTIDTKDYEEWGGGLGMGSAIFWDLCKDKTINGFDPKNVITIMTSPLSGTLTPACAGRTEIAGIGVQSYPIEWYTRSNFGGRFAPMLKYAGWDGIVLEGKAAKPVWLDIRNGDVQIRDAGTLWGLDTWATQEEIWQEVSGGKSYGDWLPVGSGRDGGSSTQRPAVLAIGPIGEKMSRLGCLIHDAGNGAGQGGFGGIWGAKNLKAISVIGTGSVDIADPNGLMEARLWAKRNYAVNLNNLNSKPGTYAFGGNPGYASSYPKGIGNRPQGCVGCHKMCRGRTTSGGNDSQCVEFLYYNAYDNAKHGGPTTHILKAVDLMQRAGMNVYPFEAAIIWFNHLHKQGILGPGKEIDCDLPFDKLGEAVFVEQLIDMVVNKRGIGKDLFDGVAIAAKRWGRLEQDLKSGILPLQTWGYPQHYDARTEVEWGYGSILGERDINEHDFNFPCYWSASVSALTGAELPYSAARMAEILAKKCAPYSDPMMADYSDKGIYSEGMAKLVAWHRHYTRYWKQSIGYCDWAWADFINPYAPNFEGITGEGEPRFYNAVTGDTKSFEDGIRVGKKIWHLHRAIWALQGRHRDQEVFADYTYEVGAKPGFTTYEVPYVMPVYEDGKWQYKSVSGRTLDRQKFEDWKTKYYKFDGLDPKTGWPTRRTLEELGMKKVADELASSGKLGA